MTTELPSLQTGWRSVVFAEDRCFRVFASEAEAARFAETFVNQHPKSECWIRNETGDPVRAVRPDRPLGQ